MNKQTICGQVGRTVERLKEIQDKSSEVLSSDIEEIIDRLEEIRCSAESMEFRLRAYRESIENLGYARISENEKTDTDKMLAAIPSGIYMSLYEISEYDIHKKEIDKIISELKEPCRKKIYSAAYKQIEAEKNVNLHQLKNGQFRNVGSIQKIIFMLGWIDLLKSLLSQYVYAEKTIGSGSNARND